jgi:hypothetical protein
MRMLPVSAVLISLLAAATPPKSNLVISPCHAGEHYQYETVPCSFELRNIGDAPIKVSHAAPKVAGDFIAPAPVTIKPHSSSYIDVKVALRDSEGESQRTFVFESDEPGNARRGSTVFAFVSSVLDQYAPTLDFGAVDIAKAQPEQSIVLSSREVADFRITGIVSKPDYLDASIDADGRTLRAKLHADAPWGLREGDGIVVKINSAKQPMARVAVKVNVLGDVVPDGSPFSLGLIRAGDKNQSLIRISSRSSRDFRIGPIHLERIKGKVDVTACTPAAAGCKLLRLLISPDQPQGRIDGSIIIDLPDFDRSLPIPVLGMLLDPKVEVHDMNKEVEKAREAKGAAASKVESPKAAPIDIKQAISETVREPVAPPPGSGPLLRWTVANEGSIYGYVIYRADTKDGPASRVSPELIRAADASQPDAGSSTYQWRDTTAVAGKTYWYGIGLVKRSGKKESLGAPQQVVAK